MSIAQAAEDCAQKECDDAFFLAYLRERRSELGMAVEQLTETGGFTHSISALANVAHNLKSSAPLYGQQQLGATASDAEQAFTTSSDRDVISQTASGLVSKIDESIKNFEAQNVTQESNDNRPGTDSKRHYPKIVLSMANQWMAGYLMRHFDDAAIIYWFEDHAGVADWVEHNPVDLIILEHHPEELPALGVLKQEKSNWASAQIPVLVGFDTKTSARELAQAVSLGAKTSVLHRKAAKQMIREIERLLIDTNRSVLIIDDDEPVRTILAQHFAAEGIKTHLAKDGLEALQIVETVDIDLIILDEMMPRMDGSAFLHTLRVKEQMTETPVIVLTAKAGPGEAAEWFRRGANDFVAKPFDPEEIIIRSNRFMFEE